MEFTDQLIDYPINCARLTDQSIQMLSSVSRIMAFVVWYSIGYYEGYIHIITTSMWSYALYQVKRMFPDCGITGQWLSNLKKPIFSIKEASLAYLYVLLKPGVWAFLSIWIYKVNVLWWGHMRCLHWLWSGGLGTSLRGDTDIRSHYSSIWVWNLTSHSTLLMSCRAGQLPVHTVPGQT